MSASAKTMFTHSYELTGNGIGAGGNYSECDAPPSASVGHEVLSIDTRWRRTLNDVGRVRGEVCVLWSASACDLLIQQSGPPATPLSAPP